MFWLLERDLKKLCLLLKKIDILFFLTQLLSAAVVGLGQPAHYSFLGILISSIGFAVHWRSLDGFSSKTAERVSFFWFFIVQLFQLSWMTAIEYQGFCFLLVYFGLAAGMALQFAFFTRQIHRMSSLSYKAILMLSSCWVLLEWSRLYFFCGFSFNFLGVFLSSNSLSLQMASLGGVLGLSFWVVFTNLFALKVLRFDRRFRCFALWGIIALLPYIYGGVSISVHDGLAARANQRQYDIVLLQTGLTPSEKYPLYKREMDFIMPLQQWKSILQELVQYTGKTIDLVVLPEAVVPFGLEKRVYDKSAVKELFLFYFGSSVEKDFPIDSFSKVSNLYFLQTLASFLNTEVAAGLDYQKEGLNYNSVFSIPPGFAPYKRYDKRILLPLAEYMPFTFLKNVSRVYGITEFFTPGSHSEVFGKLAWTPSICYEELFPSLLRESRNLGAKLFVNFTNDAWYPHSTLAKQHFTQGLIRSVENGTPLVRSSNTGVTGAVDSLGRTIKVLDGEALGSMHIKVPQYHYKTLFSLVGDAPLIVFCFLCVIFWFLQVRFLKGGALGVFFRVRS